MGKIGGDRTKFRRQRLQGGDGFNSFQILLLRFYLWHAVFEVLRLAGFLYP